jgi:hypothetical protein
MSETADAPDQDLGLEKAEGNVPSSAENKERRFGSADGGFS